MMTKAKAIFESDDTFLSFPALSPLSYSAEQLAFVVPGDLTPQRLNDASEFAHVANQIPRGVLAPVAQGEYLWEVYRDVLATEGHDACVSDKHDPRAKSKAHVWPELRLQ